MDSFFGNLMKVLRQNIREYGMYIALFVIMIIFDIASKGLFLSARNISDLINQTGYIAILAVGMTLVIVIRHIDLSVGFLAGFLGAVAAIAMTSWHLDWLASIVLVLVFGVFAGLFTSFLVAQLGIPSFVASLAGWLGFRGALQLVTAGTGSIVIPDQHFNDIGNNFIPDIFPSDSLFLPNIHKLTLILGLVAIILFIFSAINDRRKKQVYHFEVLPGQMFALELIFISAIIGMITWIMAGYRGISYTAVIVLAVVLIYNFITSQTVLGRHIYAIGGNPEAAELSGISVKRITYLVFASMGMLSALSGVLFASRLQTATTTAGTLFELDAIAAAYVGGVSAAGGVGKVVGSIIGALVMASLTNGMNLLGTDISLQYIVRAAVLALAVIFDVVTRSRGK
jgi:putative multiple sugar transport system permease protein